MKKLGLAGFLLGQLCQPLPAVADNQPVLEQPHAADDMLFPRLHPEVQAPEKTYPIINLEVTGIEDGKPIPYKFAYCAPDGKGRTVNGGNISPGIHWLDAPKTAKSFVLLVVDPDVPADFTDANTPGKEIQVRAPRQDFYHWVLTDIPAGFLGMYEGADSNGITPGGKPTGKRLYGIDGQNDYAKTGPGQHGGYDGPCPPWNDLRLHHYHFILYALDIPSLNLPEPITGPQVRSVIEGHIIGKGEVVGTYSTNPRWVAEFKKDAESNPDPNMTPGAKFEP